MLLYNGLVSGRRSDGSIVTYRQGEKAVLPPVAPVTPEKTRGGLFGLFGRKKK